MSTRTAAAAACCLLLLTACSSGSGSPPSASPGEAASPGSAAAPSPAPAVTLPPDALRPLVPTPAEVPSGMVPVLAGTGPRPLTVVAGYSGSGQAAVTALTAHGFVRAYVAQYADPATGAVVSVVVTRFRDEAGATADFADDQRGAQGSTVPSATIGKASSVHLQPLPGSPVAQLVLVRFRTGTTTWSLAYKAAPTAEPAVAIDLAGRLVARAG